MLRYSAVLVFEALKGLGLVFFVKVNKVFSVIIDIYVYILVFCDSTVEYRVNLTVIYILKALFGLSHVGHRAEIIEVRTEIHIVIVQLLKRSINALQCCSCNCIRILSVSAVEL